MFNLGFFTSRAAFAMFTCSGMKNTLEMRDRSWWALATSFVMAAVALSTSSVNSVGTGPAILSPSHMVASRGHFARHIVGTLSLNN